MKFHLQARHFALLLLAAPSIVQAAPAKKPVTKPAASKAKASQPKLIREVMGTEQLVGYEGALGQTFTVGKETAVNVTLNKAEYTVGRINIGQYSYLPTGNEKLLVLHFTVHNPLKRAYNFAPTYLTIKAVDASGVTRTAVSDMGREITHESVYYNLQPGQKIDVYSVIKVSAYGEVPKLIVQNYYDPKAPIVRYDLRGKVKQLTAPFVDPSDAKGANAPKLIPAKSGASYPVSEYFDMRVDKISYTTEALDGRQPEAGQRYCVAHATIKNGCPRPVNYSASYFNAELKDADGEKTIYNGRIRKASRDEESSATLAPGEEAKIRFFWSIPATVGAQAVLLRDGYDKEGHVYVVEAGAE